MQIKKDEQNSSYHYVFYLRMGDFGYIMINVFINAPNLAYLVSLLEPSLHVVSQVSKIPKAASGFKSSLEPKLIGAPLYW